MATTKVAAPPERKKTASVELRISYLEKLDDEHTKHVVVHITNPTIAGAVAKLIEEASNIDLAAADDAEKIDVE